MLSTSSSKFQEGLSRIAGSTARCVKELAVDDSMRGLSLAKEPREVTCFAVGGAALATFQLRSSSGHVAVYLAPRSLQAGSLNPSPLALTDAASKPLK